MINAVYHRANDNYCYPLDENQLIINIKTGYDVKKVNLIQGDPFKDGILGGDNGWNSRCSKYLSTDHIMQYFMQCAQ